MSFFGGFNDPFLGDMHRVMQRQMHDMEHLMDSMMVDPFGMMGGGIRGPPMMYGHPRQQMIADGLMHGPPPSRHPHPHAMDPMTSMMMQPFGGMLGGGMMGPGGLLGGIRNMMQHAQHHAVNDPASNVFTQSTVVSIAPGADGRPQVYEVTDSVRKTGDVKETRRSVRDSARGEERMSIGHHIGDRGHVIEKRRDRNTGGQIVEEQEFIGLKEDEAHKFDKEWKHATRRTVSGDRRRLEDGGAAGRRAADSNLAIEAGPRSDRIYRTASPHDTRRERVSSSDHARRHSPYTQTPPRRRIVRVEEPPEEPSSTPVVEEQQPETNTRSSNANKQRTGGPIIEEIE